MSVRDFYSYYEAHEADVTLEEITSCERNKRILRWLRGGHDEEIDVSWIYPRRINLNLGNTIEWNINFDLRKCNDLGWLGYFIGKSNQHFELCITGSTDEQGKDQRIINALC
jgi:hypothetical protein